MLNCCKFTPVSSKETLFDHPQISFIDSLTSIQIPVGQAIQYANCVETAYDVYQSTNNNLNPPASAYPQSFQDNYQLLLMCR